MNISAINNNPGFSANLFYQGKQITNDDKQYGPKDISEYGAKNTNIKVSKRSTKKYGREYDCTINFTLSNPIFGERTFKNVEIGTAVVENPQDFESKMTSLLYDYFASLGRMCEFYEDRALEKTLLQKVNKNAAKNEQRNNSEFETDAFWLLYDRLSAVDTEKEGLSDSRIKQLYNIAKKVNTKVALNGSGALLDKMA